MNTFKLDRGGWRSTNVLALTVGAALSLGGCVSIPPIDPGGGGCGGASPQPAPVPPAEPTESGASAPTDVSRAPTQPPPTKPGPGFEIGYDEHGNLVITMTGTIKLPDKDRTEVAAKASIPFPWPKPKKQANPQPLVDGASAAPPK